MVSSDHDLPIDCLYIMYMEDKSCGRETLREILLGIARHRYEDNTNGS
jgi:hypothetical protein